MDLRCEGNKLHGVLAEDVVEFKCSSRFCGAERGVTVLHKFDTKTGALLDTRKFKDPRKG